MKKIISLVLVLTMALSTLVGCGSSGNKGSQEVENSTNQQNEDQENISGSIEVDKKLANVKITIPASFLEVGEDDEEINIEEITEEAKEDGIKEVSLNEDGSVTYTMSKTTHNKLIEEMKDDLLESIDELIKDEEIISIEDIRANKNFSEFEVIVDKAKYENSFDGFAVLGIVLGAMYFQLFDGINPDDYKVVLDFKDVDTGEVFDTVIYPDAFGE